MLTINAQKYDDQPVVARNPTVRVTVGFVLLPSESRLSVYAQDELLVSENSSSPD